jgi:polyphosphate glucokinase
LGRVVGVAAVNGGPVGLSVGRFVADRVGLATPRPATPEGVAEVVAEVLQRPDVTGPVCVKLPAVVPRGLVDTAANIDRSLVGARVVELVEQATGQSVGVRHDVDVVGVAQMGYGVHRGDAEEWAADSVRDREGLSWKKYAHRLQRYLQLVQRVLWPQLIIIGGGVSKKADRFLPHIDLDAEIVPAQLHNDAGIVGAALFAPITRGRAGIPRSRTGTEVHHAQAR